MFKSVVWDEVVCRYLLDCSLYQFLPTPVLTESFISLVTSFRVAAVLMVALTRGRLGYQNYPKEEEPDAAAASA